MDTAQPSLVSEFQLRFASLFTLGRALSFPCDAKGCVDIAALSARAKDNYLFARGMVGRNYSPPSVCRSLAAH